LLVTIHALQSRLHRWGAEDSATSGQSFGARVSYLFGPSRHYFCGPDLTSRGEGVSFVKWIWRRSRPLPLQSALCRRQYVSGPVRSLAMFSCGRNRSSLRHRRAVRPTPLPAVPPCLETNMRTSARHRNPLSALPASPTLTFANTFVRHRPGFISL